MTASWDDILLAHADRLGQPVAISPTADAAVVDAARITFLTPGIGKPSLHLYYAYLCVQYFADRIANFRDEVEAAHAERIERERAEVAAAVRGVGPRWEDTTCVHCGRDGVGSRERGYGYSDGPLCHPNDDGPDCYRLVTVYHHPTPCDCDGTLRYVDFDPTDAELEASWNAPDAHEAHRAAWALHQEMHS